MSVYVHFMRLRGRGIYLQTDLRLEYTTCCHSNGVLIFHRSLAIGTKAGYKLFSLSSVEHLDQVHGNSKCVHGAGGGEGYMQAHPCLPARNLRDPKSFLWTLILTFLVFLPSAVKIKESVFFRLKYKSLSLLA